VKKAELCFYFLDLGFDFYPSSSICLPMLFNAAILYLKENISFEASLEGFSLPLLFSKNKS
jgi:hypothetical protein